MIAPAGRTLILIRHATPDIDVDRAPHTWELSDQGVEECHALAAELSDYGLRELIASEEPKATGTAREVAARLGVSWHTAPDLHEHLRDAQPWLGEELWRNQIRALLENPEELVMGRETAQQALARFSGAVAAVLAERDAPALGIVTHGTVMSLYAASLTGEPPYSIWERLRMPDYVVLNIERY